MSDALVLAAFISFVLFLCAGTRKPGKYAGVAGWSFIVLNLWLDVPAFVLEKNFLYPLLALVSIPFLVITAGRLLHNDPAVMQLSRTAAIAAIIFVPFALLPVLHDGLIALVIGQAFSLVTALGHHPVMVAWDMMAENGFYNQIIVGCTGILAIAMMLGVAFGPAGLSRRQAILSFLLIVPVIAVLNLLRVAVVFIAVSGRWFASFPDPTGTGDANFFWAHNVFAEGLAIVFLLVLVYGLFRINPDLAGFARELVNVYRDKAAGWITTMKKMG
jgi:archaeosortase A (PGF-CTERM-specific)